MSQRFTPRDLWICGGQTLLLRWKQMTIDRRRIALIIIKISAGYLFTKLHAIEASFLTGPRMWSRQYFYGKWTQSKSGPLTVALCLLPAHKINDKACIQLRLSSRSGTLTATPGAKTILLLCHYEPQLHKRHIQVTWVHVNIPLNEGTNERVFLLLPDSI
jgi:hypothetical protein